MTWTVSCPYLSDTATAYQVTVFTVVLCLVDVPNDGIEPPHSVCKTEGLPLT